MAKKSVSPKIKSHTIPDRESLKDFLKDAKQAWRSARPQPKKKGGRPSAKQQVSEACEEILFKNGNRFPLTPLTGKTPYRRSTSFGDWVAAIQKQTCLSQHTIEKHFTAWLLECDQKGLGLNLRLLRHVLRHNPKRAQEWHLLWVKILDGVPEALMRLHQKEEVLRPHFTYNEMAAMGNSFPEIVELVETGRSRKAILRKIQAGDFPDVRIEDFAPSAPSRK